MFKSARLRLTGWYLLIIMTICLLFSGVIYRATGTEFGRRLSMIEHRFQMEEEGRKPRMMRKVFEEDLEATKKSVVLVLIWANGVILIFSGVAGYFLAGKTLKPIEGALEKQKRFVADASHELRTPLTALKTSVEVALRKKKMTAKEARGIIKSSLEEVNDLGRLTERLLTLARYQGGKNGFVMRKTNVGEIIRKVSKKILPLAKKKGVEIKTDVSDSFLSADREKVEELVFILLDNGIKYTERGGRVKISLKESGKYLEIRVKDTGVGIGKKDLAHVFDRFYRADQSRTKQARRGFGLGLSVAKKIVEAHKGSIGVSSGVGKGSEFIVKLAR